MLLRSPGRIPSMRTALLAAAFCLGACVYLASPLRAATADPPRATPTVSHTPAAPNDDAAERHIKRTACLKEARERKLLGPDKTAFLKNCIAAS
jgi:hypothetical protein